MRKLAQKKIHHGNNHFVNPFNPSKQWNLWRLLYWKLVYKNKFKSCYDQQRIIPVSIDWEPIRRHPGLSLTFIKHASVIIKDIDQYILVDPVFFSLRFFKDYTPLAFNIREIPRPHHILITHGHYDHLDTRSLALFRNSSHFITPLGYNTIFEKLKITHRTQLDWFDVYEDRGREIMLIPCNHWTMRNPLVGPNHSLWGSYLIKTASGLTIFIAGDAAYFNGYQELGREFSIDLAIFNLGAYEPRWFMAESHMNPAETVRAFQELRANRLLIVHWGTFRLGDEPVHFPPLDIRKEMAKEGLLDLLVLLNHGQTLFYEPDRTMKIV
ncbi:MAG: MBL fold metallo-hydrolase [Deltaproteobacteria bacterium]|nr:MBL fold metallo-hydrolase [Deltaproteobacteria bacterium]